MTITEPNPSLFTYKYLQDLYPNTLKCPCSNMTIPYSAVISLTARLHQVCQSDFVNDSWISMIAASISWIRDFSRDMYDGINHRHFQLLSTLCQLINRTVEDTIYRFTQRSLVTPNVLTEINLIVELNTTLNQSIQTLLTNFNLLMNMSNIFLHVDQPFIMPDDIESALRLTNGNSSEDMMQVCLHIY